MLLLAKIYGKMDRLAAARSTGDEMMEAVRGAGAGYSAVVTISAIGTLGCSSQRSATYRRGTLQEEGLRWSPGGRAPGVGEGAPGDAEGSNRSGARP